ncbi:MAG TPA: YolD-like family protein [Clostridiales bacterium]|nr:YolD-like family protein [Clostridiales bacterium]
MKGSYDDIINLPRPDTRRPRMSNLDRAAQFTPFAALTGHEEAVLETARLTDKKPELDEHAKQELDRKLKMIAGRLEDLPRITITYFIPDSTKDGGKYATVSGKVKKVDEYEKELVLTSGIKIPIQVILEIV